ncbi:MAG: hypothetical protein IPG87_14600 [Saprospiraceae bacterium]|nr:hypothetical protein [Candidatus Vicinibacter affinis]
MDTPYSWRIDGCLGFITGCTTCIDLPQRFYSTSFFGKTDLCPCAFYYDIYVFCCKENYQAGILKKTSVDVMAIQSITWMQLFIFVLFYSLAIYHRKITAMHVRFIIGTAILMIGPPMNRILISYFPDMGAPNILPIVLYLKTAIAASLFLIDVAKAAMVTLLDCAFGFFIF